MGCDYYIFKLLEIRTKDGKVHYFELECARCWWFDPPVDSDEHGYDEKFKKWQDEKKQTLIVTYTPILIYQNNEYVSPQCEKKYDQKLQEWLDDEDVNINDITNIYKIEKRTERY